MQTLPLLPQPRHWVITGDTVELNQLAVREVIDPATVREAGDEAYRLVVAPSAITLYARNATGLRMAHATLAQLRKLGCVACLEIDDAPRFAHRGVLLDISRDRVPTMRTLFQWVDHLASWKINHLQLYVEHTLAYAGHETVWQGASPITLEELNALDVYCQERGIDLNANQNCLGHFERWLKHPRYAPLGEMKHGWIRQGERYLRPNTLCPGDPRVEALLHDLLEQQVPCCSGPYVNIGCDEPWDLGEGRSRAACEREGKGRIFARHVERVAGMVRALGKTPQYWCDPTPHEGDGLPRDLVALIWGYEKESNLHHRAAAHRAAGRDVWVSPGTSCWNSCTGRTWNRRGNLDHAAQTPDATGFLCTAWGDEGHLQPYPITLFGFADAAMAAWSGPDQYDDHAVGLHAFGNEWLGPWLAQLGNLDAELCQGKRPDRDGHMPTAQPVWNANALWREMAIPLFDPTGLGDVATWQEIATRVEALRRALPDTFSGHIADECRFSLDLSRWITDRALMRRQTITTSARQDLDVRLAELIETHRRQWMVRSRYGGLENSTAHLQRLF